MAGSNFLLSRRAIVGTGLAAGATIAFAAWQRSDQPNDVQSSGDRPRADLDGRPRLEVRNLGARGDGSSDDTAAFQMAQDRLPSGGVIVVDGGTYQVNRVNITNRHIQIELLPGAVIRKAGRAGPDVRGIFTVENLIEANFALHGGSIDLNGEGPMAIGARGRIRNLYAPLTIPSVRGIAGPANAAIFALRSSGITVSDVLIENSGENGLLFRNCGDTLVERCRFRNIANYGVEWSFALPANDGGRGPMPDRARNHVRGCSFEDHDDYALGSGNGAGVGGGGVGQLGRFRDYSVTDCTFLRCQRDFNLEFEPGSYVERLELSRLRSTDARQGGFGLVGARNSIVDDYIMLNPGYAPTSALGPGWPSIYGGSLSTDFSAVLLRRVQVVDRRGGKIVLGGDGEIAAGTRRFKSAGARFAPEDVGTFIGILGANPQGVCYVGRIARFVSRAEVELDLPAAAGVRNARFAYGGACREGLRLFHGTSARLEACRIEAGTHSGLPGEPAAAALRIENVRQPVALGGTIVKAPPTRGAVPVGIELIRSELADSAQISGFAREMVERR